MSPQVAEYQADIMKTLWLLDQ